MLSQQGSGWALTGTGPEVWLAGIGAILMECAPDLQSIPATAIGICCAHTGPACGVYLSRCHLHSGHLHVLVQMILRSLSVKDGHEVISTSHSHGCEHATWAMPAGRSVGASGGPLCNMAAPTVAVCCICSCTPAQCPAPCYPATATTSIADAVRIAACMLAKWKAERSWHCEHLGHLKTELRWL